MASWTDVARIMRSLPEVESPAGRQWRVKGKLLAWERPLRRADLDALGDAAPRGAILAVHVPLDVKAMLLESGPAQFFTTPHFDGYPAILLRLGKIGVRPLRALLEQSLQERAAKRPRANRNLPGTGGAGRSSRSRSEPSSKTRSKAEKPA